MHGALFWVLATSAIVFLAPLFLYLMETRGWKPSERFSGVFDIVVALLVLGHLLPECYHEVGWLAILLAFIGFSVPLVAEYGLSRRTRQVHFTVKLFLLGGLMLHGIMDGAMLGSVLHLDVVANHGHHAALPLLLLHKIPVSLAIWRNSGSRTYGWLILLALAAVNCGGYLLSSSLQEVVSDAFHYGVLALVSGSFVHLSGHNVIPYRNHLHAKSENTSHC